MKKILSLILALVATTTLWAYDFQAGDLYYNITSSSAPYTVEVDDATSSITIVTIPETVTYEGTTYSVTSIGDWAFGHCSNLTSVTIPNSVTSIGIQAFYYCESLTSMIVESGNSIYDSRENCNAIIETATNILIAGCQNTIIPNSVTSIGYDAFNGCSSLISITIPNSVTSIGNRAFSYCESLTSVTIPNSVTSIGDEAFHSCFALTSVTIPNSVTSIGNRAFSYCESLTSVTIPDSVTSIGYEAFWGCESLTSVTIGNSVTSIGAYAFVNCDALTSIAIPNNVTSIGNGVFWDCNYLTSIVVESGNSTYDSRENCNAIIETATNTLIAGCQNTIIPNSVTSIGDEAFSYCEFLTSVTIPNSVTSIGHDAFHGCSSLPVENNLRYADTYLVEAVDETLSTYSIKEGTKWIGDDAFSWCSALTSITIPNSVTSIGEEAFCYCESLTTVTIPNSVTSIEWRAFYLCESLKTVICEAIEVPELGYGVFNDMPLSEATLYVPAQSLDDYKAAEQWKEFGTILPIEGESEEEIELQDTEMTIVFTNSEDNDSEIYRQTLTIKVPIAPTIAGFTFLYWQPVAEPITNEITIQAIYEADTPTSAEVYTNPANPTQKLLRNGQVYILQDGKTYTVMGQEL